MLFYVTELRSLIFLPKAVCSSHDRMNCACKDISPFPHLCRVPAIAKLLSICQSMLHQSFNVLHWCSLGSGHFLWSCRFSRICLYWAYSLANNIKSARGASNTMTILQSLVKIIKIMLFGIYLFNFSLTVFDFLKNLPNWNQNKFALLFTIVFASGIKDL